MTRSRLIGVGDALATMANLSNAVVRNINRRALEPAAGLLRDEVEARAPLLEGNLKRSVRIDRKPSKRRIAGKVDLTVIADDPAAVPDEYGTSDTPVLAFFRPAIDAKREAMFEATAAALQSETIAAAQRVAKRGAK